MLFFSSTILANPINVVVAENFYGQLAKQIGGNHINVSSIISNPNADPHLFTTGSKTNKEISQAQIIIYNGANYDAWMEPMLKLQKKSIIINVANLMHLNKPNINPHIWYKPETMPELAVYLTDLLVKMDEAHKIDYTNNLAKFLQDNKKVQDKIKLLKLKYANINVTATEPVFNYMTDAIGLKMQGLDFQWKIMNNTEPSPKMYASFLNSLNNHTVSVLFYNKQVVSDTTKRILTIAHNNHIPVVGVTETMPANISVNTWLLQQLNQTQISLQASNK
jgi:zinc/manganese transport system substrate-binding protein